MFKNFFGKKQNKEQEKKEDVEIQLKEVVDIDEEKINEELFETQDIIESEIRENENIELEDVGEQTDKVEELKEDEVIEKVQKTGFFQKLLDGLNKTRKGITDVIDDLLTNYGEIDDDLFEELEEILIMADVGMDTTMKIIDELRDELKRRKIKESSQIKEVLFDVLMGFMANEESSHLNIDKSPSIVFFIGVNGVGKTTSIGKLAARLKAQNKKVLLSAADTFRAAAIDQLKVWADRTGVDIIAQHEGADPASVVFDSISAAKSRNVDVLIVDTAGRLHNKKNLMNELEKIFRIVNREFAEAEKEVLLVLDATTGQNAVQQAKLFKEVADITGLVLTKLDGTAKGGAVLAIKTEVGIPVKLVGVGEKMDDLENFEPESFVKALLQTK